MVGRRPRGPAGPLRWTGLVFLTVLLLAPIATACRPVATTLTSTTAAPASLPPRLSVLVTADGHSTDGASSPSSAVTISLDTRVNVTFAYNGNGANVSVGVARLELFVLGVSAGAKELDLSNVHPSASGSVSVVGDYSYAKYLIEGVFAMHATLLDPNGSVLFAQTFYMKIHAPYDLTVVTVVFALLVVYEVYAVVSMGSAKAVAEQVRAAEAARGQPPAGGTP